MESAASKNMKEIITSFMYRGQSEIVTLKCDWKAIVLYHSVLF